MKTYAECLPCILKQVMNVSKEAQAKPETIRQLLIEASRMLPCLDMAKSPAHNSTLALRLIPPATGVADPYKRMKSESNRLALSLLPDLETILERSPDRLRSAALIASAGNVIDLAIQGNQHADLKTVVETVLREGFARDDVDLFRKALKDAKTLVYLADNAGEIVFDRVFARELAKGGRRVIVAVHGGPILNDAGLADAREAGLEGELEVVSTGSDWIGLEPDSCDPKFLAHLKSADVVVAKGHGNFETTDDTGGILPAETYYILRAKCEVVAETLGVKVGQVVFKRK